MSKELVAAAASYFGLDPERLFETSSMHVGAKGALRFVFAIEISEDDYLGIADRMRAMREPLEEPQPTWSSLPSLQQVMRDPLAYIGQVGCADLIERACKASRAVALKVAEHTAAREQAAQGVGEREVKHVAAPADEEPGLPDAVWVDVEHLTSAQLALVSDVTPGTDGRQRCLIQSAMLTPEQRAKAGVQ